MFLPPKPPAKDEAHLCFGLIGRRLGVDLRNNHPLETKYCHTIGVEVIFRLNRLEKDSRWKGKKTRGSCSCGFALAVFVADHVIYPNPKFQNVNSNKACQKLVSPRWVPARDQTKQWSCIKQPPLLRFLSLWRVSTACTVMAVFMYPVFMFSVP